jgi:hypothetical protein
MITLPVYQNYQAGRRNAPAPPFFEEEGKKRDEMKRKNTAL